jgi:hypothetical protein
MGGESQGKALSLVLLFVKEFIPESPRCSVLYSIYIYHRNQYKAINEAQHDIGDGLLSERLTRIRPGRKFVYVQLQFKNDKTQKKLKYKYTSVICDVIENHTRKFHNMLKGTKNLLDVKDH